MAEQYHKQLIEQGETMLFDKRHSLWEIWKNFIIGAVAIVALILLQTNSSREHRNPETNWGYIILISILALFFILVYGAWPLFRRRRLPKSACLHTGLLMVLAAVGWIALMVVRERRGFHQWMDHRGLDRFRRGHHRSGSIYPIFAWFFAHFILTDRRLILSQGIVNKSDHGHAPRTAEQHQDQPERLGKDLQVRGRGDGDGGGVRAAALHQYRPSPRGKEGDLRAEGQPT